MVLGPTVWKLYTKQLSPKELNLKIKVKDNYVWLQFNWLTSIVDLQTHDNMMFESFAMVSVEFRQFVLENERILKILLNIDTQTSFVNVLQVCRK